MLNNFFVTLSSIAISTSLIAQEISLHISDNDSTELTLESDVSLTKVFPFNHYSRSRDFVAVEPNIFKPTKEILDPKHPLCYRGDIDLLCELFKKLSETALTHYEDGEHELTSMTECKNIAMHPFATITLKSIHDFDRAQFLDIVHKIDRCRD